MCCGHMLLTILTEKKLLKIFMKNNRNNIKQSLELEKEKRKKAMNCMLKGKNTIIHLTTG